ncbi:MAG TPA: high-affinity nickel-transport family protein [Terriglobia bacterium]|nr:high-affinity nickel-transport family protein [Terriglobia bacterium]
MATLFAITLLGFVLGMRHATDPDHVIAVTTIVARQRSVRTAASIGVFWGIGHTLTILLVGAAIILFKVVIPPRLGLTLELAVGLMLILLGALNLTGVMQWATDRWTPPHVHAARRHTHAHAHGDYVHSHAHGHEPAPHGHAESATPQAWLDSVFGRIGLYQMLRPLVVGIVHGLAGSAAVALLVLTTIHNPAWAIAYLLVFGAGTIAGMMLITAAIAVPAAYTGRRFTRLNGVLAAASGVISLVFGCLIAYRIGIVDGLFTPHPRWTPR